MKNKKRQNPRENPSANTDPNHSTRQPPAVAGQCAEVLAILLKRLQILRLELTFEHGIAEAPARICELRDLGFNVITTTEPEVTYRGRVYRRVARYSLGVPAWPAPGFLTGEAA